MKQLKFLVFLKVKTFRKNITKYNK